MINFQNVKGFIFDNDGVIVNSEPLSCKALRQLFIETYNVDIGIDYSQVIGTSDLYTMNFYHELHNLSLPKNINALINRKMEIYFDIAENKLEYFDGFHKLLKYLQQYFELAIASSGNHDKIKFSIKQVDASHYFPIICSATEVKRGKPAPDLFQFTAECMGLNETQCVVIEDSIKGIQGAKSAGMYAIGFTSSFSKDKLIDAGADIVIDNFVELLEIIKYKN